MLVGGSSPFGSGVGSGNATVFRLVVRFLVGRNSRLRRCVRGLTCSITRRQIGTRVGVKSFICGIGLKEAVFLRVLGHSRVRFRRLRDLCRGVDCYFSGFLCRTMSECASTGSRVVGRGARFVSSARGSELALLNRVASDFVRRFEGPLASMRKFVRLLGSRGPAVGCLSVVSGRLRRLGFEVSRFLLLSGGRLVKGRGVAFSLGRLVSRILVFLCPDVLSKGIGVLRSVGRSVCLGNCTSRVHRMFVGVVFGTVSILARCHDSPIVRVGDG